MSDKNKKPETTVSKETEIKFTMESTLAAIVSEMLSADRNMICSDVKIPIMMDDPADPTKEKLYEIPFGMMFTFGEEPTRALAKLSQFHDHCLKQVQEEVAAEKEEEVKSKEK